MNEPIRVPPRPDTVLAPSAMGRVTWPWWEVVLAVLVAWVIGAVVVSPLVFLLRPDANEPPGGEALIISLCWNVVSFGVLFLWLRSMHPGWMGAIGWPPRDAMVREIAVGAGLGILVRIGSALAAAVVVMVLRGTSSGEVQLPAQVSGDLAGWEVASLVVFAVIVAPAYEEFVYRGLLFRSIADRHGFWPGALVSAFVFGASHLGTAGTWPGVLALGITLVGTGFGLAWIYWRRRNLLACISGHAMFNLIGVVLIIAGVEV